MAWAALGERMRNILEIVGANVAASTGVEIFCGFTDGAMMNAGVLTAFVRMSLASSKLSLP